MAGYPKVKGLLIEKGIKQQDIAKILNISRASVNNKLNGKGDFSVTQVCIVCEKFNIEAEIFFKQYVPKTEQRGA